MPSPPNTDGIHIILLWVMRKYDVTPMMALSIVYGLIDRLKNKEKK